MLPDALPGGSRITFEPGGQLELSGPPRPSARATPARRCAADTAAGAVRARPPRPRPRRRRHRHPRRPPARPRRPPLPGDGALLRRALARGSHDDAQHRVDPGEPRHRRSPAASTRAGTWRTTSGRCSAPCFANSPFDPSGAPSGLPLDPAPRCGTTSTPPAPARRAAASASTRADVDALRPRRAGDDDPRRRRRQPRARAPDDRSATGSQTATSRLADARRPRVPPHHAVPAGAAARLARAAHDRRAARASGGRSRSPSPPRCSTTRSPPPRAAPRSAPPATAGRAAARDGAARPGARRAPRSSASPRCSSPRRARRRRRRRSRPPRFFDRFVARGRCPADELLDDWLPARSPRAVTDVVAEAEIVAALDDARRRTLGAARPGPRRRRSCGRCRS